MGDQARADDGLGQGGTVKVARSGQIPTYSVCVLIAQPIELLMNFAWRQGMTEDFD